MNSQKVPSYVTPRTQQRDLRPAKAGVQKYLKTLDSGFRRNDRKRAFSTFYETVNIDQKLNQKLSEKYSKPEEGSMYGLFPVSSFQFPVSSFEFPVSRAGYLKLEEGVI